MRKKCSGNSILDHLKYCTSLHVSRCGPFYSKNKFTSMRITNQKLPAAPHNTRSSSPLFSPRKPISPPCIATNQSRATTTINVPSVAEVCRFKFEIEHPNPESGQENYIDGTNHRCFAGPMARRRTWRRLATPESSFASSIEMRS